MASEFSMEENYFDRLPADLIISIFEKFVDVKCLCISYLVSKEFATHVLQTRFVSVQIPSTTTIGPFGEVLPIWPPGVLNFLKKLPSVEYATIQFSLQSESEPPLVRWKADSSGLIFVSAESRVVDSSSSGIKATRRRVFRMEECDALFASIKNHIRDLKLRFLYIKELIDILPNLKNVSALDSMKQGSVVLEKRGIARMKKENPRERRDGNILVKIWIQRMVKLPFSGCAMNNVAVVSTKEMEDEQNLLFEEKEYREVAMTMMSKPTFFISGFPSFAQVTIADFSWSALKVYPLHFWRYYYSHMRRLRRIRRRH